NLTGNLDDLNEHCLARYVPIVGEGFPLLCTIVTMPEYATGSSFADRRSSSPTIAKKGRCKFQARIAERPWSSSSPADDNCRRPNDSLRPATTDRRSAERLRCECEAPIADGPATLCWPTVELSRTSLAQVPLEPHHIPKLNKRN
ncbi:hypothetical protein M514_03430, partial [Trichuris suis]